MRIEIESTSKIVTLITESGEVPARIWEGKTARGVKVICFVTRVVAREGQDLADFERDLAEQRAPRAYIEDIPLRLIL